MLAPLKSISSIEHKTVKKMPRKDDYDTMVYKMIRDSDVVIEVVDARFPSLTRTKKFENMVLRNSSKTLPRVPLRCHRHTA